MVVMTASVQAQNFGQALLQGVARGLQNAAQMQQQQMRQQYQQQNANSVYQQSKNALNNSSFSLANTHAPSMTTGTVRYTNGSVFTGKLMDGKPLSGVLEESDGTKHHCSVSNGAINGWCFTEWTDGSWYYGIWKDGVKHGEGSYYDGGGEYYDMIYNNGNIVTKTYVITPKHSKDEWLAVEQQKAQILIDALNEQNNYSAPSSSSSTSRSSSSSTSGRACGVCYGSGKCRTCNGNGTYIPAIGRSRQLCPSCTNHNGLCKSCNGTGRH